MGDEYPRFKVAAVHAASVFLDREATVDKACRLIAEAGGEGARLIAFPEAFIPGYPSWIWTHTPTDGAPFFARMYANSVEIGGDAVARIGEAARKAGAYVVMGVCERDGGTLYNSLLYFDDNGRLIGRHRKLQPTHVERTVWGRGDGSDLVVYDTPLGKLGGLICWEHTMDLVRYTMAALGEQVHIAAWPAVTSITHNPHANIFDNVTEAAVRHHALASQSFVICVQSCLDEQAVEAMGMKDRPDMMRPGGGWSAIIGPDGQIIAGPNRDKEAIVYADIDLADIILAKYACDSAGHYARPDVVQLQANFGKQSVMRSADGGASPGFSVVGDVAGFEPAGDVPSS